MKFYDKIILPKIVDFVCRQNPSMKQRAKIIPLAVGNVLEIGIGSGLNLPFYQPDAVKHITAIDPSIEIWNINKNKPESLGIDFDFIQTGAESIDIDSNSIDSVVITYTLCTIPELASAFDEIKRVIKPSGKLYFCEHGKAPDKAIEQWQNRITPIWKRLGGGCHLNRDIPKLIVENGFKINQLESMYIPGWKPASFNYWGTAQKL